jgi:ABC-type lipoprotein export system ATPase subunit
MINLANVSKTGASGSENLTILHAVNLSIPRRQLVAVVGPSGGGKSTLSPAPPLYSSPALPLSEEAT